MRCLAYFLTFRTFGTWLPGDERGFVDHARRGRLALRRDPHRGLHHIMIAATARPALTLNEANRAVVEKTLREVCAHRAWALHGLAVRSNHVHVVITATDAPEKVLRDLKSWATRRLLQSGGLAPGTKPWARHGSTRYLWDEAAVMAACQYTVEGQGDPAIAEVTEPAR